MLENKSSGLLGYISTVLAKSVKEEAVPGGSRYLVQVPSGILAHDALRSIIPPLHSSLNIDAGQIGRNWPPSGITSISLHFSKCLRDRDSGQKEYVKGQFSCNFLQETREIEVLSPLPFSESLKADLARTFLGSEYIAMMQKAVRIACEIRTNCLQNRIMIKAIRMHPETALMLRMLDMVGEYEVSKLTLNIFGRNIPGAIITEDDSVLIGEIYILRTRNMLPDDKQLEEMPVAIRLYAIEKFRNQH